MATAAATATATLPAVPKGELIATAAALATRGKGILACDESVGTIGKRLIAIGLTNDAETRRAWREVLLSADNGDALAGAILFAETLRQTTSDGTPFPELLARKGILVGVKVDLGLHPVDGSPGETWTSGLDGLHDRCRGYYALGARFAKWRCALKIDASKSLPSDAAVRENASTLARYARIAQQAGLVPIVEPEILIDGDHDMSQSAEVARRVIKACYSALRSEGVSLNATLLKPMMVLPGLTHPNRESVTPEAVARATLDCMRASVPGEVPGILFLSGGLSETEATRYLCAINRLADAEAVPWTLSFSFGRALQSSAMKVWGGRPENVDAGRTVAAALARVNAEAQLGKYSGSSHPSLMEDTPLYEGFRGHRSGEDPVGA